MAICCRDIVEPVGETMFSLLISRASEERRLMATLGEYALPYTLPPKTLVRLEYPPIEPSIDLPLPRPPKPC
jgi:hypothetical protein